MTPGGDDMTGAGAPTPPAPGNREPAAPFRHVALVHYWLTGMGGGERVLQELLGMFPSAAVFAHAVRPSALPPRLARLPVRTSWIARLPGARRRPQLYLPLMPLALEALDLRDFDLVISCESGPAKGVIPRPDALHLCYCHSPMRYLWDLAPDYAGRLGPVGRLLWAPVAHYLRLWDTASAARLDAVAANSAFVAARVRRAWGRAARVIHPPVDVDFWAGEPRSPKEFYLLAGRLVAYKQPRLALEACRALGRPLVVAGDGPMLRDLRRDAGRDVVFAGRVSDLELRRLLAQARALLFPGVEDFGMLPVEAMACGAPVVALGRGGALETVRDGHSGVLFSQPTPEAMAQAILRLEALQAAGALGDAAVRAHARRFAPGVFTARMKDFITAARTAHAHPSFDDPHPPGR